MQLTCQHAHWRTGDEIESQILPRQYYMHNSKLIEDLSNCTTHTKLRILIKVFTDPIKTLKDLKILDQDL